MTIVILLCVLSVTVQAETDSKKEYTITGRIFEKSSPKTPIPLASIFFPELGIGTVTKMDGTFIMNKLDAGTYKIEVTSLGYEPIKMTIVLGDKETVDLKLFMEKSNFRLNEVVVTAQNNRAGTSTSSKISRIAIRSL